MKIGLDIDGVIAKSLAELVTRFREQKDNTYLCKNPYSDWHDYNIENVLDVDRGWIDKQFKDPAYYLNAVPFEDAYYAMVKWFNWGHDIHLITRRFGNAADVTERWLNEWTLPYNTLSHSIERGSKWEKCKELECDVFVDDDGVEVSEARKRGVMSFLRSHKYNRNQDAGGAARIIDLRNLEHHVKELNVEIKLG